MKKLAALIQKTGMLAAFSLLFFTQADAQYNVEILTSTTVYVKDSTVAAFKGVNWVSASDVQGVGPVIFNGSSAQNIDMNNLSISGLTIDNTNNVTMLDSMTVANTNTFTAGNLLLGNYRITLEGKVDGNGATGRFTANGNSSMVFSGSGGSDTFYLDQSTPNSTNRLNYLTLNRNSATLFCGDTVQIRGVVYHLAGTIDANDSRLKLKALSPVVYGQVAGIGTGTIADTMYAEFEIGDSVQSPLEQWRHFTSPLKNATLVNELNDDITLQFTPIENSNIWTFSQDRGNNCWRNVAADEEMHNNHYAIYLWPLSYGFSPTSSNFRVDINGTYPGTGNFPRTLGRTNPNGYTGQPEDDTVGWHMIPNPYPSNISFQYQPDLEGGSSYYVWDITGIWDDSTGCGGCKKRGVYATYRADNGLTANGGRSVLGPFQVFYVRAAVNNASFSVDNSWRTTDSMYNNIGRKADMDYDRLNVKVTNKERVTDELYVWFDEIQGNNKYDRKDGLKLMNDPEAPNIYTLTEDKKRMVFNVLKDIPDDVYSVEMPFVSSTPGAHELTFKLENQYKTEEIYMEDRKTGKLHNVQSGAYKFNHDTANYVKERFVLHFRKKNSTSTVQDYLDTKSPVEISTDSRNILVSFPQNNEKSAIISIYDMLGRQVMDSRRVDNHKGIYTINAAGLSSGYYVVKVQTGNTIKSAPVVISNQ